MTIDVQRRHDMPQGRHPADELAADMERLYRTTPSVRYGVALSLEVVRPRVLSLEFIRTVSRRRGLASRVLDQLALCADRRDVMLILDARAVPDRVPEGPPLSQHALEDFYARRGFRTVELHDGAARMRRLAPTQKRRRHGDG
jgi:hypothetical protein